MEKNKASELRMSDVAKRAGVSISTVSRILGGQDSVAPHLCEKVMRVVENTGYRKLRGRSPKRFSVGKGTSVHGLRAQTIAFLACEKLIAQAQMVTTRYHEMLSRVHAKSKDYGLGVMLISEDSDKAVVLPKEVASGMVGGVVVANEFRRELMEKLSSVVPVVVLNSICRFPALPSVTINDEQLMFKAFDYLVKMGHQRIAFFEADLEDKVLLSSGFHVRRKLDGYHYAVEYFNTSKNCLMLEQFGDNEHPQAIKRAMDRMLNMANKPTAIITSARYASFFAYEAANRGISIPDDLSLIATDDPVVAGFAAPDLTSFRSNLEVETAVEMLVRKMAGETVRNQEIRIEPELIIRKSTGPVDV